MIPRYTRPEMGEIWSDANRFQCWLDIELALVEALIRATAPAPGRRQGVPTRTLLDPPAGAACTSRRRVAAAARQRLIAANSDGQRRFSGGRQVEERGPQFAAS